MRQLYRLAAGTLLATAAPVSASVTDPLDDFLSTYTAAGTGAVDILSGDVAFDGTSFFFTASMAGNIGGTPGQLYAWGIDRGAGTPRIDLLRDPDIAGDILFDAVIVMLPNGTMSVVTIPAAGPPTFTNLAGGTAISGNTLSGTVPLTLLPSTGLSPDDYTFGFWSRIRVNPAVDGTNNEIADFLEGSGSLNPRVVPEPATWLMMLMGFGMTGCVVRRGRPRACTT